MCNLSHEIEYFLTLFCIDLFAFSFFLQLLDFFYQKLLLSLKFFSICLDYDNFILFFKNHILLFVFKVLYKIRILVYSLKDKSIVIPQHIFQFKIYTNWSSFDNHLSLYLFVSIKQCIFGFIFNTFDCICPTI